MKTIITTTNSKLGHTIPSINMPVGMTCRPDAPCFKNCYARKGHFTFSKVKQGLLERYQLYKDNPEKFFDTIVSELSGLVSYKYVRWHSTGDIVDMDYLYGMIKVANKCPNTNFLCFTKKFDLVNLYLSVHKSHRLPKNLHIVFSAWDKNFIVDNPYNLPMTYVNFNGKQENANIPEIAIPCKGDCSSCLACWELKKGQSVVFDLH